ncbi:ankyrin-3-like, partial, partial [Paramuricea clavata]
MKGNGPLHIACLAGQTKVVQILLDNGANVNLKAQNGFTPLYMASQENHVETVKLLLANGANLQALTEDGFTALDVAVQQDHETVVVALLRSEKRKGFHALHDAARKDLTKPIKFLIQKGHAVDIRAPNGFTPLHIAAKYNSANAAVLLTNSGADIDALTKTYAITPLHAASKFGHANIVTVLLQAGAKPDKPNR